ncbi:hypothetical protein ACS0TY_006670 [Phlomoides rotata]
MASPFDSSFTLQAMVMVKLTSSNYLLWHSQVHPILFSQKFLCFVDGSAPALPKTVFNMTKFPTTNSEYTKWYSDDQIVRVFFSFTLNEEALSAIIDCTISREILDSFVVAFNCPSKVCDLRLKDELQFIKKGTPLARGRREHGLYILEKGRDALVTALKSVKVRGSFELWHRRLGHAAFDIIVY